MVLALPLASGQKADTRAEGTSKSKLSTSSKKGKTIELEKKEVIESSNSFISFSFDIYCLLTT